MELFFFILLIVLGIYLGKKVANHLENNPKENPFVSYIPPSIEQYKAPSLEEPYPAPNVFDSERRNYTRPAKKSNTRSSEAYSGTASYGSAGSWDSGSSSSDSGSSSSSSGGCD